MSETPSQSPIDAGTFLDKLACGFGRVVLFLRQTDAVPFRDAISDSCFHHRAFDRQTEDYRTEYLLDMIQATGEPEFYAARIRQAFASDKEEYSYGQLYALALRLALNGDEEARRLMYDRFARCAASHDTTGAEEIVALDGLDGYLFVANQWQRHPLPEEDHWEERWLLERLEEQIGLEEARQALVRTAQGQPELAAYLAEVAEKRAQWKAQRNERNSLPVLTYDEITALIADPTQTTRWQKWRSWGRRLDEETLARLAQNLLTEEDRGPLLKLLHVFRQGPFPLPIDRLLQLARGRDEDLADAAQQALGNLCDPRIRVLAWDLWNSETPPLTSLHMLRNNFAPGDYARIESVADSPMSADDFHRLGIVMRELIEANPAPEAVPTLLALYEHGRCTICRCSVVERLLKFGPLPPWMLEEGRYDADMETRSLIAGATITAGGAG